jgi:hypothetical protein
MLLKNNIIIFIKYSVKQKKWITNFEHKFIAIKFIRPFIIQNEEEKIKIILENYGNNLSKFNGKMNLEEALSLLILRN